MEHAEAHEQLSDLALEPRRLAALARDPSPQAAALRTHVSSCEQCAANLAGWQRTWAEIGWTTDAAEGGTTGERAAPAGTALTGPEPARPGIARLGASPPLRPPPELRDKILAAVGGVPRPAQTAPDASTRQAAGATPGGSEPRSIRRRAVRPWLVTAAAVAVAVLAGVNSYFRTAELDRLHAENAQLALAAATLDRVLAADRYWTVTLRTADGTAGGTLAWSAQEVVVLTSGLPAPGPGQAYRCWLERDGSRTPMGWMAFSRSTGYWAGSMRDYGTVALKPGGRFGVSLVPVGGSGTPVLIGEL